MKLVIISVVAGVVELVAVDGHSDGVYGGWLLCWGWQWSGLSVYASEDGAGGTNDGECVDDGSGNMIRQISLFGEMFLCEEERKKMGERREWCR